MAKWPSPWNEKLLLKTAHLSPYEMGALSRMLMHMCGSPNRTLPNDDIYLARITGTGRMWKTIKPALMPLWVVTPENRLRCALLSATSSSSDALKSKTSRIHSEPILTSKRRHSGRPGRVDPLAGDMQKAFEAWNETALRLGLIDVASKLTDARQPRLRMRLKEYGLDGWMKALAKIEASPFLRGETYDPKFPGWKGVHIDFLLQQESFTKLMEGKYDDKRNGRPAGQYRNGFAELGANLGDLFKPAVGGGESAQTSDINFDSRGQGVIEAG